MVKKDKENTEQSEMAKTLMENQWNRDDGGIIHKRD